MCYFKSVTLSLLLFCCLFNCKKAKEITPSLPTVSSSSNPGNGVPSNVFIAGSFKGAATYWNNGKQVDLTDTNTNSLAQDIEIVGKDIYIAGTEKGLPKYWKNGIGFSLPLLLKGTSLTVHSMKLAVEGNDVYVIGTAQYIRSDSNKIAIEAQYWKNSIVVPLEFSESISAAYSILIKDDLVYVAGVSKEKATVWKNGISMFTTNKNDGSFNSISEKDGDIYMIGYESQQQESHETYWKNFIQIDKQYFKGNSRNIKFYENDLYEPSVDVNSYYSKNGIPETLKTQVSYINSPMFEIANKKIYLMGTGRITQNQDITKAILCIDGTCNTFTDENVFEYITLNDIAVTNDNQ